MLKVGMLTQQRTCGIISEQQEKKFTNNMPVISRYLCIIWFSRILYNKSTSVTGCRDVKKGVIKPVWMRAIF